MRRRLVAAVVLAVLVVLGVGGWQLAGALTAEAETPAPPPEPCISTC